MKIGIIGLGRIGKVHLNAIAQAQGCEVVAVTDIDQEVARQLAQKHQIAHVMDTDEALITHKDVDAVWICSPSNEHFRQVDLTLGAGKLVFCEKPLATNISDIKTLIEKHPDIDTRLMVGFNRRFDPHFRSAKAQLDKVGTPTLLRITSKDPAPPPLSYIKQSGGLFKDMTIHDFDMARYMASSEVTEVYAQGGVNYVEGMEGIDIDTALLTLTFENHIIGSIENSRKSSYGYDQRLEVHGTDGMVQVGNVKENQCMLYSGTAIASSLVQDFFLERYQAAYAEEVKVFMHCATNGSAFPATANDALKALEIAEACALSLKEHRPVGLAEME